MDQNKEKVSLETDVAPDFTFDLDDATVEFEENRPAVTTADPVETPEITNEPEVETPEVTSSPEPVTPPTPVVEEKVEEEEDIPEGADPQAYGIYSVLVDKGYVQEKEGFKGTFDELNEVFEELPEQIFQSVFQQFPDPMQNLLRYAFAKGEHADWKDITEFVNKYNPVEVESVDISTEEAQRNFLARELKKTGEDDEDIQDRLDLWEDKGKLEEKSKQYLTKLKSSKTEGVTQEVEETENTRLARKQAQREFFTTVKTEVDKTGWTAKRKQEVVNEIFSGNLNAKSQLIRQHPVALYQLADFMTYYDSKTGQFNLDAYTKQGLSGATEEVKNNLAKHFSKPSQMSKVVKKEKEIDTSNFEFKV